jgi:hypothetical protein
MTTLLGDTGKLAQGPLKTFNLSFATPTETLLGTPVGSLPTANPGTPQITITVQTSDLPIISPSPKSLKYSATLYAAGKNTDAASQTINYQCYKNGVAIPGATGSQAVATNTFWTLSNYRFYDIAVGDVLGVSLWCASANMNYDYYALTVYPTRVELGNSYINRDVAYSNGIGPILTAGVPSIQNANGFMIYPCTSTTILIQSVNTLTFGTLTWNSTYQSFRTDRTDNTIGTGATTHATNRPFYQRNVIPGSISFREVLR